MTPEELKELYRLRSSGRTRSRLKRFLTPPLPLVHNPAEPSHFPLGAHNLYVGGAGRWVDGFINLDLFPIPGVDVAADAHSLPFPDEVFTRIECDAVIEHVVSPEQVVSELVRVVAPGGYLHLVTPFCHPFHPYPADFRRFTPDGLKLLAPELDVAAEGWRTGPTATLLLFQIEYVKLWFPSKTWRACAHTFLGWILFPLRYLDLLFFKTARAGFLGNHCYLWLRKPPSEVNDSGTVGARHH